ncbi:MAG TPA: ATP-dependent DNA helicase, partial [Pseudomonadales bacterium]|nr:ATP-dependent DNA helicase [Pseudomonadales bacterium]
QGMAFSVMLASGYLTAAVDAVDIALGELSSCLEVAAVRSQSLANCFQRVVRLVDRFAMLTEDVSQDDEYAHWIQMHDRGFVIHLTPVSIAAQFGAHVRESGQAWIMTSATLAVNESFDHVIDGLGIEHAATAHYSSPFDFGNQVKAWLPSSLPRPGDDEHTRALVAACMPVLKTVAGRTFFLFTSYRALNTAALCLEIAGVEFLAQGNMSRQVLLERFRSKPRAILLATYSFWEGIDVRGADLQCLIIDKLPFASPDDAVASACARALQARGGNGFVDYTVPEAAISLRQGFGRLVREESDRGLFILGDPRVRTRSYGKLFVRSLPEMVWLEEQREAVSYMKGLAAG